MSDPHGGSLILEIQKLRDSLAAKEAELAKAQEEIARLDGGWAETQTELAKMTEDRDRWADSACRLEKALEKIAAETEKK